MMNKLINPFCLALFAYFLTGCGEPHPKTVTIPLIHQNFSSVPESLQLRLAIADPNWDSKLPVLEDVLKAEFEDTKWVIEEKSGAPLELSLDHYSFSQADSNQAVPGWLIPGFFPFGPLSIWWWRQDDHIATPELEITVSARLNGGEAKFSSEVVRAVAQEDDLARVAFSEVTRSLQQWFEVSQ